MNSGEINIYPQLVSKLVACFEIGLEDIHASSDIWEDLQLDYDSVLQLLCDVLDACGAEPGLASEVPLEDSVTVQELAQAIRDVIYE